VVATEPDKFPMLDETKELNVFVVVATLELKDPILELRSDVVVATEPDKPPILEDTEDVCELNELVKTNWVLSKLSILSAFNEYDELSTFEPAIPPSTTKFPGMVTTPEPLRLINKFEPLLSDILLSVSYVTTFIRPDDNLFFPIYHK
jgi:hypothetical protein